MKKFILFLIFNLALNVELISQDLAPAVEIYVRNETNSSIYSRFYPVSAVFAGRRIPHLPKFTMENMK